MGGRSKEQQIAYDKAHDLYVNSRMNQREIAEFLAIQEKTLSTWVNAKDGKWKKERSVFMHSDAEEIVSYKYMIHKIQKQIREEQDGMPESGQVDMLAKLQKNVSAIDRRFDLGVYKTILDEFMHWMTMNYSSTAGQIAIPSSEFLRQKSSQLYDD